MLDTLCTSRTAICEQLPQYVVLQQQMSPQQGNSANMPTLTYANLVTDYPLTYVIQGRHIRIIVDLPKGHKSRLTAKYSKFLVIWYPGIQHSHPTGKNFNENLQLLWSYSKTDCDTHMFTHHTTVLLAATSSTTCHVPSCRCHYSRGHLNLWSQCSIYIWNISHMNPHCSPRKTPT